ncbi:transcriptional regulator [Sphingomonas morindae]|uniref:Helix-turn-helix domain-containing protein n=1 Tax=Sphingomonas morindae TaxID=1541170 RepID=A0ABY4XCQ2_9SPHN|nr:YdaS family helix-turn-helix protein [Sphingomonas morindae]USI74614.1 helix-turn-helix domain-containing protein [Sphingomonas morindae]
MDINRQRTAFRALEAAARAAGSWTGLAAICGCTPGNLSQLKKRRSPLPGHYVLKVEAATGVSRYDLRPDIFTPVACSAKKAVAAPGARVRCGDAAPSQRRP